METPTFEECVGMLRSKDPMTYEDGYQWLQGFLSTHFKDIVVLMQKEQDEDIRSKFVELVGDSKRSEAIPILEAELKSDLMAVRSWAYSSLLYFEDPVAEKIAEEFRAQNPNEDFL
ncbi:HEAT repeat domain-containing protein [Actomonas aquatica]|uniref:HEAT repeat domain-containing protein n=1 Tax=Actomonas aquatica TaxID=2866162 RepID=A0ABZ1CBZ7_9BACT|nr:HEAT repeat domain-containing protein [Opitutus sp. WL0086]WRQ88837.1 HEAT repeat domain-containing protein [Opitutus sp. WL0086]